MKQQKALYWLVPLIAILAVISASVGIFLEGGNGSHPFTTLYGTQVNIYGRGIYQHDSAFAAPLFRGTDWVTLFLAVPVLLLSYLYYGRGSLRSGIVLTALLTYFLYIGVTYAFSVIFNPLFLIYVMLFSASLFATITAFTMFDATTLTAKLSAATPRRGMGIFMIVAGLGTLMLWLSELINPALNGTAPTHLGPYTTMFTHGFDSAVITPATVLTGLYLLQRKSLGDLFVAPLLILCTIIGIVVIAQTVHQAVDGIIFPIGVYIGMIGSWVVMGMFAISFTLQYFHNLEA